MIEKVCVAHSSWLDTLPTRLMPVSSKGLDKGWLQKQGSTIDPDSLDLEPVDGHSYTFVIPMGAYEITGQNRNADRWVEEASKKRIYKPASGNPEFITLDAGLKERYHTFEKNARCYVEHKNKDPSKASGDVVKAGYNDDMHRVELICCVDNDVWDDALQKMSSGENAPVSMACFLDPETPVRTENGYEAISSITPGTRVLTHRGTWKQVQHRTERSYSGRVREIKVEGLPFEIAVTEDHPWFGKVLEGSREQGCINSRARTYFRNFEDGDGEWVETGDLQYGDRLFYRASQHVPDVFGIDDTELAYLMGVYTGDGSLSRNNGKAATVRISCGPGDAALDKLPEIFEDGPTVGIRKAGEKRFSLSIHDTQLAVFLEKTVGTGCREKTIPACLFNSPRETKQAFLSGWLDADGWCDKKGAHWSTVNRSLALLGRDLLAGMQVGASIYSIDHPEREMPQGRTGPPHTEYTLNISNLDVHCLGDFSKKALNSPYRRDDAERKKPPSLRPITDKTYAYRVKNIREYRVEDRTVYNLEVADTPSYAAYGISSHNCGVEYDVCSYCGNRSKSRRDYCGHIKFNKNAILQSGHQIGLWNEKPTFKDLSKVRVNADRLGYGLATLEPGQEKTASSETDLPVEVAQEKRALLKKLSEIEKEIGHQMPNQQLCSLARSVDRRVQDEIPKTKVLILRDTPPAETFGRLADEDVLLPPREFFRVCAGPDLGERVEKRLPDILHVLPKVFRLLSERGDLKSVADEGGSAPPNAREKLKAVAKDLKSDFSLEPDVARYRVQISCSKHPPPKPKEDDEDSSLYIKFAGSDPTTDLAAEYGKYVLDFLHRTGSHEKLAVLSNFADFS